jgi:hypothetical protein
MKPLSYASLVLILHTSFWLVPRLSATNIQDVPQDHAAPATATVWQSTKAEHVYGLSDINHNQKSTLTIGADAITFTGKSGNASIPRSAVTAVSAGNQRVELFGMTGIFCA